MSNEKVVPITDAKTIAVEKSLREEMFTQSVRNFVIETCSNSPSLGFGDDLDVVAGEVAIKLFDGMLTACVKNPNLDTEIFFDSFRDDLLLQFGKIQQEFTKLQRLKTALAESDL